MQPITVDYVAMEEAASAIQSASSAINSKLSDLASQLKKLQWDGEDRNAYMAHQAKWDSAVADMNQILNKLGGAVQEARGGYGATETSGANAWS